MRPVLLDVDGFGSFREPASVDFTDTDYFALVGPTGSGKSTIVDALTFALYGSVPRWRHKGAVQYALAPTAQRGTVRLIFDLDGRRYIAARELRRTRQGVQVKSARLELLQDPAARGGIDDATDVLAADSMVTPEVEKLLGLSYEHFCQCVVLPQGEFAEFLRAKGSDRRAMLLKLLGFSLYGDIAQAANTRAKEAAARTELYAQQLAQLVDATEQAQAAATDRAAALEQLAMTVTDTLPQLADAETTLADKQASLAQLDAEHTKLRALALPADVAELDARRQQAQDTLTAARDTEADAQAADSAARDALAAGPARGPLEKARADHADHATVTAALPAARATAEDAGTRLADASAAVARTADALEGARTERDDVGRAAADADAGVDRLTGELDALRKVRVPAELPALHDRLQTAAATLARADDRVTTADAAETAARTAREQAPARGPLDKALADLDALEFALAAVPPLESVRDAAAAKSEQAHAELDKATETVEAARAAAEAAAVAHRAAELREHLTVGEACPVCEQEVAAVPPAAHAPELAAARQAVTTAQTALSSIRSAATVADRALAAADAQLAAATGQVARLRAAFDARPDGVRAERDALTAQLAQLDGLAADERAAATELRAARTEQTAAQAAADRLNAEAAALRTGCHRARDPLVALALDVPDPDTTDLLAAWTQLASWAGQQADVRTGALPAARRSAEQAEDAQQAAQARFAAAEQAARTAREQETAATGDRERARAALTGLERRLAELDASLAGAPTDADALAQLTRLDELEAAARTADTTLRQARTRREQAARAAAALDDELTAAWTTLRTVRDGFVGLRAPDLPTDGILAAWSALLSWTGAQAEVRAVALPAAQNAVTAATSQRDETEKALTGALSALDVALPPGPLASTAPAAVATALTRARAEADRIAERRAEAARVEAEHGKAQTDGQVARMLGNLLRSDKFPEWLEAEALDALVLAASASLSELSGGQFELTHRKGEFFVVDHADADSLRSVRTLSGGETFQASLALALALSSQLSSLAAAGAARLDSIFLDEGFGTLDETTLEVVAATLENLASGNRMVGVITHVAALAERVPVRFAVSRDAKTSTIERESAA